MPAVIWHFIEILLSMYMDRRRNGKMCIFRIMKRYGNVPYWMKEHTRWNHLALDFTRIQNGHSDNVSPILGTLTDIFDGSVWRDYPLFLRRISREMRGDRGASSAARRSKVLHNRRI